jgi:hypothetical protein
MATVTYTANEGCRFEEFEPFTRGGVTVARTVSGNYLAYCRHPFAVRQ